MKKVLREKYKVIRNNIIDKKEKDNNILENLITILNKDKIMFYYSIKGEPNIENIVNIENKKFYLPYCEQNNLVVREYDKYCLVEDDKGIISSFLVTNDNVDIVIVPAIACNYKGYRLGYGFSYYDRFFVDKPNIIKICVVYEDCLITEDFQDEWDIPFDYIVTEKRVIRCNNNV